MPTASSRHRDVKGEQTLWEETVTWCLCKPPCPSNGGMSRGSALWWRTLTHPRSRETAYLSVAHLSLEALTHTCTSPKGRSGNAQRTTRMRSDHCCSQRREATTLLAGRPLQVPGVVAPPPPGDHTSSTGSGAGAVGAPARPVSVYRSHRGQLS